jgi:replicative DNA helicase
MQVGHLCRELKKLAQELKIVIVVASQLNRSVEMRYGKRPVLSDLRDSGSIEQDADKVLFIYRPEYYGIEEDDYGITTSNTVELILAKNRIGKTGTVQLLRDEGFTFFESYDARTAKFLIDPRRRQDLGFQ